MKLIKITIKSVTKAQLKKIYYWFNDQKMSKYLRTRHRTMKRIIEILSRRKTHNFMINENGVDIGYIYITKRDNFVSLTILVDKKYWGKGYGKQAMILIEKKVKRAKSKKIVLGLYPGNRRALNLYNGLGYIQTKSRENNIIVMEKKL